MDITHGYVAWISLDMSGYLLDISSGYLFLDISERYPILPKDIQEISFHILSYPEISTISRDIQMGRTPRWLREVVSQGAAHRRCNELRRTQTIDDWSPPLEHSVIYCSQPRRGLGGLGRTPRGGSVRFGPCGIRLRRCAFRARSARGMSVSHGEITAYADHGWTAQQMTADDGKSPFRGPPHSCYHGTAGQMRQSPTNLTSPHILPAS
jgi:hypothetical protein